MALGRRLTSPLLVALLWAAQAGAQDATGTIRGRVLDAPSQQPLASVNVVVEGTNLGALTRDDGNFVVTGVPAGARRVRVTRIGYAPQTQDVTVTGGGSSEVNFSLDRQATVLQEVVSVGYGTQRREAITGSVATVDAEKANVGVVVNANQMIQGRVAGVNITQNSGEPGAGSQIRIRGGTSISASNEPLYVIDGVPIDNTPAEPGTIGIGGSPSLPRNPLNLINPNDIESITVLKDASSTAIYGSRAANGVILIQTKNGSRTARPAVDYDTYVAFAQPAKELDLLSGPEFDAYVRQQVALYATDSTKGLKPTALNNLGGRNTDWQDAVTRDYGFTHNHNLAFASGGQDTRYRASLNFMDQQGVLIVNGLRRYQGRLNATHEALEHKLRLGLNLNASQLNNIYIPTENDGGFEGGVLQNMVIFNPTQPVTRYDAGVKRDVYYEVGGGTQSVRNPVALANQIRDEGVSNRVLGNASLEADIWNGLTATSTLGIDRLQGTRRTYWPKNSPVGATPAGLARQAERENQLATFNALLKYQRNFADVHAFDVTGGYEYSIFEQNEFGAQAEAFISDATGFNNLGGGSNIIRPYSLRERWRLASFLSRANYGLMDRYFVTGVLRYDGSSRFPDENQWALFPAISGSWRISEESFFPKTFVNDLKIRAGWGLQGNPAVRPYAPLPLLEPTARYVFGNSAVTGIAPTRNPNPDLKWETTAQTNIALDYGFLDSRFTGSLEYYVKNTRDLLLEVDVPAPAFVNRRLENIGRVRNAGVEFSIEALAYQAANLEWSSGLTFEAERNKVIDIGKRVIPSGNISGQGQSGQYAQRIMTGYPLGTFFGAEYVGVNSAGQQIFADYDANGRRVGTTTTPNEDDFQVIGNANPDFTIGWRNNVNWRKFDLSMLVRGVFGNDVFNNTSLLFFSKSNILQSKNTLRGALSDGTNLKEPAKYSSRWIEDGSFVRISNLTLGYTFDVPGVGARLQNTRAYLSIDNLALFTDYSGYDPEVHTDVGLASRGIDYLKYPRTRTYSLGARFAF